MSDAQLLITGLAIGLLIAAPVGPVNVLCIQRTLERGFWGGFAAGLGAVLADGLIATAATFGITAISGVMVNYKYVIQLAGGLILIAFGAKLFWAEPKIVMTAATNITRLRRTVEKIPNMLRPLMRLRIWRIMPHAGIIPQTFFLTITNPGAILGLFAIVGGLGSVIGGINTYAEALILIFAVMAGNLLWWIGLARLISRIRHRLNEDRLRTINQAAGVLLFFFGAALLVQLALGWGAKDEPKPPQLPSAASIFFS